MPLIYASSFLFIIWLGLLFFSEATRKEQLIMSLLGLLVSPGALSMVIVTAGSPAVQIDLALSSVFSSISLFGIASVAYQALLSKRPLRKAKKKKALEPALAHVVMHIVVLGAVWILLGLFLFALLRTSPIQALMAGALVIGVYVIAERKDLLEDALFSGLFIALLIFLTEWFFQATLLPAEATIGSSGIYLLSVPIEEVLWAGVVGFGIGPLYEYLRSIRLA